VQVRTQIQSVDVTLPVFHAETLDKVLSTSLSVRRFSMEMVALFAVTALLLAGLVVRRDWNFVANATGTKCQLRLSTPPCPLNPRLTG
jgi:hypothetical protein